jgi:hypothetical protein
MNCYTSLKKKRNLFREKLIDAVEINTDNYMTKYKNKDEITEEDIKLLKYQIILDCIGDKHILPLGLDILNIILALIPQNWKEKYPCVISEVTEEIKKDYILSIKKATVDFLFEEYTHSENYFKQVIQFWLYSRLNFNFIFIYAGKVKVNYLFINRIFRRNSTIGKVPQGVKV